MKKKNERILLRTKGVVDSIQLIIDDDLGGITTSTPCEAWTYRDYHRTNKDKIVSRIPSKDSSARFCRDEAIIQNYEYLFAVDTNTKLIRENKLSICAVNALIRAYFVNKDGMCRIGRTNMSLPFMVFTNSKVPPEKLGWEYTIREIMNVIKLKQSKKIGVVVDAHLSEIDDINTKVISLRDNYYLPENISLIYASTDTGKDDLVNKIISYSDKGSTLLMKHIENGYDIDSLLLKSVFYPCDKYKIIHGLNTVEFKDCLTLS